MALTKTPIELSSTPSIVDGGNATAITIDSSENVGIGTSSPTSTYRASIKGDYSSIIGGIEFDSGGGDKFTVGHASATSPSATLNVVGAGNLIFKTSNTERMRIDSSGNVGINQSSPAFALCISDDSNPNRNGMEIAIGTSDTAGNTIQNYNRATSAYTPLNIAGSVLTFGVGTNATERMRIDSDGQVGVSSRKGFRFGYNQLQGNAGSSGGGYPVIGYNIRFTENSGDYGTLVGDSSWRINIGDNARLQVHSRSGAAAVASGASYTAGPYVALNGTSWTGGSDERLKENVSTIAGADAIAKVKAMRPVNYSWVHDSESANQLGFIAQEMALIVPEVVDVPETETDAITGQTLMWGITYDRLIPLLTSALQEALTKIETLEGKVQTLENN